MISETEQWARLKELFDSEGYSAPYSFRERETEALTLDVFVRILRHGKRLIFACGLGGLAAATLLAFVLPPTYSASASFVPPGSTGQQSSLALLSQLSALGGGASLLGGRSQGDLYVGILKSHSIARYLVEHYDLEKVYKVKKESLAEKILRRNSVFEAGSKDPIVTVTVTDGDPLRARDLASGYLQALQISSAELALTESSQRRLFFEHRLAKEKDDLADAEVAMKQAEEKTGLIAPGGQTLSEIQTLAQLNAQITAQQAQLAALLNYDSDENPDVLRKRSEIGTLQAKLEQMQTGNRKEAFGRFSAAQVPGMELEYIRKAREVKYQETLFEIIAKQYEAARLDEAKDSPLQVLDHPTVPDMKSGPHRSIIMALGLLAGLLAGTVWTLIQYARRQEAVVR
jgi:tyrosine-protein kinase Etk/Wzc